MWRDVTGLQEITQVHIQKVETTRGDAVAEIAKYSAKDYEMAVSQEVFDVFYSALKRSPANCIWWIAEGVRIEV
ncbi:hypothetical protein GCM10020331_091460 [Ectobacillus funiculus]